MWSIQLTVCKLSIDFCYDSLIFDCFIFVAFKVQKVIAKAPWSPLQQIKLLHTAPKITRIKPAILPLNVNLTPHKFFLTKKHSHALKYGSTSPILELMNDISDLCNIDSWCDVINTNKKDCFNDTTPKITTIKPSNFQLHVPPLLFTRNDGTKQNLHINIFECLKYSKSPNKWLYLWFLVKWCGMK